VNGKNFVAYDKIYHFNLLGQIGMSMVVTIASLSKHHPARFSFVLFGRWVMTDERMTPNLYKSLRSIKIYIYMHINIHKLCIFS
jgi:hypothetical protein